MASLAQGSWEKASGKSEVGHRAVVTWAIFEKGRWVVIARAV